MFSLRHAALRASCSRPLHLALLPVAPVAAAPPNRPLALALARSYAAAPAPSAAGPRSPPPKKRVRSLVEIEADQQDLRLASSGGQWTPTTEPGEREQSVVYERPSRQPPWLVATCVVFMTSASVGIASTMLDLTEKEVVDRLPESTFVEEDPLSPSSAEPSAAAAAHSTLSTVNSALPFKLPSVSSNWAFVLGALSVAFPAAVLALANKSCARIVQYRPSGRLRVYTRLTDFFGRGTLVDFGIAESTLTQGAKIGDLQLLKIHLPPLGLDLNDPKANLKFPTVNVDIRPLREDELQRRAAGQNITVDPVLIDRAFNGISVRRKAK